MEKLIEELIIAIQSLGQRGWFDYIQLVATVTSIIISAIAVFVAVKIPKQIAEQQLKLESKIELRQEDLERRQIKISLYEHRLKYWNVAKDIYFFLKSYLDFMDKTNYKEKTNKQIYEEYLLLKQERLKDTIISLKEAEFVFPPDLWCKLQEIAKRIDNICYLFEYFQLSDRKIATDKEVRKNFDQNITRDYIYETNCITEELLRTMEVYLTISDLDVWEGIYSSKK
ncbi:MAG: hypothetical protein ACLVEN_01815 [Anaerotignum lactatifermentans]|uniref:hypothetical protein n=1 Tax=Anaerotignum lactatifermentans TaxID=160404 RepID=UPI00399B1CA3